MATNVIDTESKDVYWDDIEIWQERAMASYGTHRCIEASTSTPFT